MGTGENKLLADFEAMLDNRRNTVLALISDIDVMTERKAENIEQIRLLELVVNFLEGEH